MRPDPLRSNGSGPLLFLVASVAAVAGIGFYWWALARVVTGLLVTLREGCG